MEPLPIPSDPNLLKTIIEPLLEDFIYWFDKSEVMLSSQKINFMDEEQRMAMVSRLQEYKKEIFAAQSVFKAMNSSFMIEPKQVQKWHSTVTDCWSIATQLRAQKAVEP